MNDEMSADNKVTEWEIYDENLDVLLPPVIFRTEAEARKALDTLISISGRKYGSSGGWRMREVVLNERPIPPWAPVITSIPVEEARQLAARHGIAQMVILALSPEGTNVVTVGKNKTMSDLAYEMSKYILKGLGYDTEKSEGLEDRRGEHLRVPEEVPGVVAVNPASGSPDAGKA